MSNRLKILEQSLEKKQKKFDVMLQNHFDTVKQANGQPLNDKRNGATTLRKWDKQNDALRKQKSEIEKTQNAIEKEMGKIANVESVSLPPEISELIESGAITQWRKHPTFFFVNGAEKARIHLLDDGSIAHRYLRDIPNGEQYAIFRDVFNALNKKIRERQPV